VAASSAVLTVLIVGCVGPVASSVIPTPTASGSPERSVAVATQTAVARRSTPAATTAGSPSAAAPPIARLIAGSAGGSGAGVDGDLGTFDWNGTVSDSPWLPGADIAVRVGQGLRIEIATDWAVSWTASIAPGGTHGQGKTGAGSGDGAPTLQAPTSAGTWELGVKVTFALGEVRYHWRLTVT
jgi:hypothetical protein